MAGAVLNFPDGELAAFEPLETTGLALPADGHLVAAAMAAERLRGLAIALTSVMQGNPRDAATFARVHSEILNEWLAVEDGFNAYHAVLSCKGQA